MRRRDGINFELGKQYIVEVKPEGIIIVDEFNRERFFDKDTDDLDFLTYEEKLAFANRFFDAFSEDIKEHNDWTKGELLDLIDKWRRAE